MSTIMDTPTRRRFDPDAMKKLRKKARLTQPAFATASGIPLDTVRMYEQARTMPSLERLVIIADTLGCRIDDLFAADSED